MTDTDAARQRDPVVADWLLPDFYAPERGSGPQAGKVIVNGKAVPAYVARQYAEAIGKVADFADKQGTTRMTADPQSYETATIGTGLTLIRDRGGCWVGSFEQALIALAQDAIADAPAEISVVGTVEGYELVRGLLTYVDTDGHRLRFEDGLTVDVSEIDVFRLDS